MARKRNRTRTNADSANMLADNDRYWYSFQGHTLSMGDTQAGEVVTQESLMTSATCYACTKVLGESVAGLPRRVYQYVADRKEIAADTLAHEILNEQPNPEMDPFTFWELGTSRIVNRGNFFAEIQRDNSDKPIGLWPIHNSRVTPVREPDGSLMWEISRDYAGSPAYQDPTWRQEHLRYISPHNMLNIVGFGGDSFNGILGLGLLPGAQEIGMEFATRRYGGSFFAGGATPSGFVEHPGFIDNESKRKQFREDLNAVHNNKTGGNKIGVLWQGATYKSIGISPEQAQFLETRKFTADQICKFYGVPPAIIGDYEHSKFATADAMIRAFVMMTLRNLCQRIEDAVYRQVMCVRNEGGRLRKAFGNRRLIYKFVLEGLTRGDAQAQAAAHKIYRDMGITTTNEIRDDIGLNPLEGPEGEFLIVPGGYTRLQNIDNQGDRMSQSKPQDTEDEEDSEDLADAEALAATAKRNLVEALERETHEGTQVRGYAPAPKENPVFDAMVEVATDAVDRIHGITLTQIERWREQDPAAVQEKMPAFWSKQQSRLLEALGPADTLARRLGVAQGVSAMLSDRYVSRYASLDNYSIFDPAHASHGLPTHQLLEELIDATAR